MEKVDVTEGVRELYTSCSQTAEVVAERAVFICIDCEGEPTDEAVSQTSQLLYAVVYKIRAQLKAIRQMDFKLAKLEFRWMSDPHSTPVEEWRWRLLLRVPDEVTQAELRSARKVLLAERNLYASGVKRVCWREGRALQVMHTGPRGKTDKTCAMLRERAVELGYRLKGTAHEVYISNPVKTAPERMKTLVRLPIAWPRPDYARRQA